MYKGELCTGGGAKQVGKYKNASIVTIGELLSTTMLHLSYSFFCLTFALVIVLAFLKFEAAVYPYTTNLSSLNLNGSEHNIVGNTSSKMATEERLKYTNYIPVILEAGRGASKTYHAQLRNAAFEIVRQTDCFQVVENNTSNAIVVTDATSVNQYPPEQPLIALHTSDAANDLHFLHSPNVLLVLTHIAFVDRNVYQLDRYPLQSSYWYYCSNREQPCRGYTLKWLMWKAFMRLLKLV